MQRLRVADDHAAVDRNVKMMLFTIAVKNRMLDSAVEFHDVALVHAEYPFGGIVKLPLVHLLAVELLPAAAQHDLGVFGQPQEDAPFLQQLHGEIGVGGEAHEAQRKAGFCVFLNSFRHRVKIGGILTVPVLQRVCPAERRREERRAEGGLGDGGVIAAVRLVAEHDVIAGHSRKKPPAMDHTQHHVRPVPQSAQFKPDAAEFPAGAGGGRLHDHPVLRHGVQLVILEEQRRQEGQPGKVFIGLKHVGGKALRVQHGAVFIVVPVLVGAVLANRAQEQFIGSVQIINVPVPEQSTRSAHKHHSFMEMGVCDFLPMTTGNARRASVLFPAVLGVLLAEDIQFLVSVILIPSDVLIGEAHFAHVIAPHIVPVVGSHSPIQPPANDNKYNQKNQNQ